MSALYDSLLLASVACFLLAIVGRLFAIYGFPHAFLGRCKNWFRNRWYRLTRCRLGCRTSDLTTQRLEKHSAEVPIVYFTMEGQQSGTALCTRHDRRVRCQFCGRLHYHATKIYSPINN